MIYAAVIHKYMLRCSYVILAILTNLYIIYKCESTLINDIVFEVIQVFEIVDKI